MRLTTMTPDKKEHPTRRGRPPGQEQKKLTLNVPIPAHARMQAMAAERGEPVTRLIRNAYMTYMALTEILNDYPNAKIALDGTANGRMLDLKTVAPTLAADAWT